MERGGDEAAAEDGGGGGETAGFECNICFGLAQDPVITLCGHLHCWPCLYEWLRFHSQSHECPVCKAVIRDEQLITLYGRGGDSTFRRRLAPLRPAATDQFGLSAVRRRVRFREVSGYGAFGEGGGDGVDEEGNINIDDNNMKKILFFILVFVVFDFLII